MQNSLPAKRRMRLGIGAAIAIGALMGAAACSADAETEPEQETPEVSTDGTPEAVDAPTTLTVGVTRQPSTLDPIQLSAGTDTLVWGSVYDTLFIVGPEGELVPHMATDYAYNDDGTQLTINLRDDLEFSNGEPATAADFKATLEYVRDTPGAGQAMLSSVVSVDAPSDNTAVITLSEPDPGFLYDLAQRAGIIAVPELMTEEAYGLEPIGAGPYVLDVENSQTGNNYVLVKRDDHWNADAYPFAEINVRVIPDTTAAENALKAGELDISAVQAQSVPQFPESEYNLHTASAANSVFLDIADRDGSIQPALADVRVRQAINMAFDRAGMVTAMSGGVGAPTGQMFFPTTDGYDPALDELYPFDPDAARALLAEAGYADGFSIEMPSIVYTTTFEPAVTQALADIGITVEWTPIPPQDTVSAVLSGTYPVIMWFASVLPAPNQVGDYYAADALLNPMGTTDPELDALLERASQVIDPTQPNDVYAEINAFGTEQAWFAPLFYTGQVFAGREGYAYVGTDYQPSVRIESYGVAGS